MPVIAGQPKSVSESLLQGAEHDAQQCEQIKTERTRAYDFQAKAASGDPRFERWLVLSPMLRQDAFLDDLDRWKDYSERSRHYIERSLASHRADDLPLLIALHAPKNVVGLRPPYRVNDDATFVALVRIAHASRVPVEATFQNAATRLERPADTSFIAAVEERARRLSGPWLASATPPSIEQIFMEGQSPASCQ
ncbi:hypothetical protein [Lysobacter xanthus]